MELVNEFRVPVPIGKAWEVLTDVERIAPCIPGAELLSVDGDDFTGKVEQVNTGLLNLLLDHGYFPVLTPPALSFNHEAINVDGDRAAAAVAVALHADTLLLLTSAPGLLSRFPDEDSLLLRLSLSELDTAIDYAQGKMKRKVLAAQEALHGGVPTVIIGDGRRAAPLRDALAGAGTRIEP